MSYDSKIQFVRETIENHNSNVEESDKIDFDKVMEGLRKLGATTEDTLKGVTWEDLEKDCGIPRAMARTIANKFRKGEFGGNGGKSAYVSEKQVKMMSYRDLLERYNPKDKKSPVAKRLKDLSDNKTFIVFDKENKVIVDESVRLLEDIIEGLEELTTTHIDGIPTPVYKIGERPDFYLEENPLYPSEALRSGETCIHTGRSWKGISTDIRQLLYLAISNGEMEIESPGDAIDVIDRVVKASHAMSEFRSRCPQASLEFDRLAKLGKLPLLKVRIGDTSGRKQAPFGQNVTY